MRFLFRALGFLIVAGGFVALVVDGTRAIANEAWAPQPFGDMLAKTFPKLFPLVEPWVTKTIHPAAWNPVMTTLLATPTFVVGLGFGLVLMFLARARREDATLVMRR